MRSTRGLPIAAVVVLLIAVAPGCGNSSSSGGPAPAGTVVSPARPSTSAESTTALGAGRTTSSRPTPTHTAASHATTQTRAARSVPQITGEQVTAVGDSVMVATEPDLEALLPGIAMDAVVGRGVDDGLTALAGYADSGELRDRIVVELGTNSPFSAEQFEQLVQIADGRPLVVVTNHCDRCSWTEDNNAMLRENCDAAVTCTVADWEATAKANPQFFADDGIHVAEGGDGAHALAQLILAALG